MEHSSRAASGSPSLEEAQASLRTLPNGTYTLRDIAERWPQYLPAAMVLIADATRPRRRVAFRWLRGNGAIDRTTPRDRDKPMMTSWNDSDIVISIDGDRDVQVTMGKPKPRGKPRA